jgi:hypothetical protein
MPSYPYFGALLGLAASLAAPANAQTRSDSPAAKVARVEQVLVHAADKADAALTVEIQTSGARVAPNTQVITGPDRIIVDFPGALPAAALHALKVNQGVLTGVRTGLFFNDPPITRVVLDLAGPQAYQISTTGNGVVVKLTPVKSNSAKLDPAKSNPAALNLVNPNAVKLNPAKSSPATSSPAVSNSAKSNSVKSNSATLNSVKSNSASNAKLNSATLNLDVGPGVVIERYPIVPGTRTPVAATTPAARLAPATKPMNASPAAAAGVSVNNVAVVNVAPVVTVASAAPLLDPVGEEPAPPKPLVSVTFANGMLSIHSDKATLAQVLYEVQRQTQAEIAIPAGAEQEEVAANLGPASARDVLASLLNGSGYNFIFIGSPERLERVILTLRDPNIF